MNTLAKLIIGFVAIMLLALGLGLSLNQKQSDVPPWVHELEWQNKPDNAAEIEGLLWTEISPYRTEYEKVNISGRGMRLRVIATANDSDSPDIYDFEYEENKLLLTGYLLEAIPQIYRSEAISIALGNQEVAASIANSGSPTVRRILPGTSKKFYAPKTLLSVTWKGVSALIDPEERKVVNVWKEGNNDPKAAYTPILK